MTNPVTTINEEQHTEIAILQDQMNIASVIDQVNLVQNIMGEVMKKGKHYGLIPGCGKKNVLYKAGAEILAFTFRLNGEYEITETNHDNGHREYKIIATIKHINTNKVFSQGVGSCSTLEGKYKNRSPADFYNTVLKMAKKRAFVDGIISATGASDIFTQDLEDLQENGAIPNDNNNLDNAWGKSSSSKPSQTKENNLISESQINFAHKLMKNFSKEKLQQMKAEMLECDTSLPENLKDYSKQQAKVLIDKLKFTKESKKIIDGANEYLQEHFDNGGI